MMLNPIKHQSKKHNQWWHCNSIWGETETPCSLIKIRVCITRSNYKSKTKKPPTPLI
ncbi:hypothetical protein Hanom_Chr00s001289g01678991 [Helianthus anomalus]